MDKVGPTRIGLTHVGPTRVGLNALGSPPVVFDNPLFSGFSFNEPTSSDNDDIRTSENMSVLLSGSSSYVVSVWTRPVDLSVDRTVLTSWVSSAGSTFSLTIGADGSVEFRAAATLPEASEFSGYIVAAPAGTVVVRNIYHMAGYVDTTDVRLFINGVEVGTPVTTKPSYYIHARPLFVCDGGINGTHSNSNGCNHGRGHFRDVALIADMPKENIGELIQNVSGTLIPADLNTSITVGSLVKWLRMDDSAGLLADDSPTATPATQIQTPTFDYNAFAEWDLPTFGNVYNPQPQAILFDSAGDAVIGNSFSEFNMQNALAGATSYGVSLWFKITTGATGAMNLVASWSDASLCTFCLGLRADHSIQARAAYTTNEANNDASRLEVNSSFIAADDTWVHVAMFVNASTIALYVNGVLDGRRTDKGSLILSDRPFYAAGGSGGVVDGALPGDFRGHFRDLILVQDLSESAFSQDTFIQDLGGGLLTPNNVYKTVLPLGGLVPQWFELGPSPDTGTLFLEHDGERHIQPIATPTIDATGASALVPP